MRGTMRGGVHLSIIAASCVRPVQFSSVESRIKESGVLPPRALKRGKHLLPARVADELITHHVALLRARDDAVAGKAAGGLLSRFFFFFAQIFPSRVRSFQLVKRIHIL